MRNGRCDMTVETKKPAREGITAAEACDGIEGIGKHLNPIYNTLLEQCHELAVEWSELKKLAGERDDHAVELLRKKIQPVLKRLKAETGRLESILLDVVKERQVSTWTVDVAGLERYDGEKSTCYVLHAVDRGEATMTAMLYHRRMNDVEDVELVGVYQGEPAANCGFHWNDIRGLE